MEFNATFIFSLVSFLVFMWIMNIILYKPIANIVAQREKYFKDNAEITKKNNEEVDVINSKKEEKLESARAKSREEVSSATNEIKELKDKKVAEKKEYYQNQTNNLTNILTEEKMSLQNEFDKNADELSNSIVQKIIGGN